MEWILIELKISFFSISKGYMVEYLPAFLFLFYLTPGML